MLYLLSYQYRYLTTCLDTYSSSNSLQLIRHTSFPQITYLSYHLLLLLPSGYQGDLAATSVSPLIARDDLASY